MIAIRKSTLLLLLLLVQNISSGQGTRLNFPGKKFSIIPPDSTFVLGQYGPSIVQEKLNFSLLLLEGMDNGAETVLFEPQRDLQQGQKLCLQKDTLIDGNPIQLVKIMSPGKLVAGIIGKPASEIDGDYIIWLTNYKYNKANVSGIAIYPADIDTTYSTAIEQALISVRYDDNRNVSPVESLPFSVDVTGSNLQFAKLLFESLLIYSEDGLWPTQAASMSMFSVTTRYKKILPTEYLHIARKLNASFSDSAKIISEAQINIDGLPGVEIVLNEQYGTNKTGYRYWLLLFEENQYFEMSGGTGNYTEDWLTRFRKIAHSFKRIEKLKP